MPFGLLFDCPWNNTCDTCLEKIMPPSTARMKRISTGYKPNEILPNKEILDFIFFIFLCGSWGHCLPSQNLDVKTDFLNMFLKLKNVAKTLMQHVFRLFNIKYWLILILTRCLCAGITG